MDIASRLNRHKRKRILVLSAGSLHSGIQGIYLETSADAWHILSSSFIPYPARARELIENLLGSFDPSVSVAGLAWLDRKIAHLFLDCAKTLQAGVSKSASTPHLIVLNRLPLWSGAVDSATAPGSWNLLAGSAHLLAQSLGIPVLTDCTRQSIFDGSGVNLPLHAGIAKIALRPTADSVFVNVGLTARVFVVNRSAGTVLVDREPGPGMHLINLAAQECGSSEGFDRDGLLARQGRVDGPALEALTAKFLPAVDRPQSWTLPELAEIYREPSLAALACHDRLATVTALTARTIFQTFKRECPTGLTLDTVWISGGGTYNLTLRDYLAKSFEPLKVCSIEDLEIPPDLFFPAALGLSVQTWLESDQRFWSPERNPRPKTLGAWVTVGNTSGSQI